MRGYKGRNCKVLQRGYGVVGDIVRVLQQYPGGYLFWNSLPQKGVKNEISLKKKWVNFILTTFLSNDFLVILINAAVSKDGGINDVGLYNWLWKEVYGENTEEMYKDWLQVKKEG